MWKCIRCEKENQDSTENCVNCGHGRTMDYTGHRVLSKIRPEITDTWKYTQINPDILKIQAGKYLVKAESLLKIAGEDSLAKKIREMMREVTAEAIVNRYEGADLSNVNEKPMLMPDNISVYLSADSTAPSVLGSKFLRKDVCEIDFVKMSLDDIPSVAWDVSADKNGEIWAWMDETPDGYILNIGSENGVYANTNCNAFFCYYWDVKKIEFNNLFDTSCVMDMNMMFHSCDNLTELDVSGFKTDKVRSMAGMFWYCIKLESLDVSKFDTKNVTDMTEMFWGCENLQNLDISNFYFREDVKADRMFERSGVEKILDGLDKG